MGATTGTRVAELVDRIVTNRTEAPPPRATYRVQLNHTFTFADAAAIVPYLASLGISHLYASPIFKAEPGSMHGYDVVDYGELNPELGTRRDFDALVDALHAHGMELLLDFVPNHMGIANGHNAWWQDVLENGEASPFASWFDIDWTPLKPELRGKVLLPILGDQYGNVLEAGELRLSCEDGAFTVHYYENPLPISPPTYPLILRRALPGLESSLPPEDIDLLEFQSLITALERLTDLPGDATDVRMREQAVAKHRLATLVSRSEAVAGAIAETIAAYNGVRGDPRSFDALDELLQRQAYRVAFWRVAGEEINYRRFFAINTLAAIRQEEPAVFAASHGLVLELLAEGKAGGLRIDHIDGLLDPAWYLRDLQRGYVAAAVMKRIGGEIATADPLASHELIDRALDGIAAVGGRWPLYIVVEKILEAGETLPEDWAVAGTVGYEFAQEATELFVDGEQRRAFDRIYQRITGERGRFHELMLDTKRQQLRTAFTGELNVLVNRLSHISEQDRHSRDLTQNALRQVLREIIACFPVYRTYTTCAEGEVPERAGRYIDRAVGEARRRNPALDPTVFDFVRQVLLQDPAGSETDLLTRLHACDLAMKAQQLTGPVMAKGLEDTAFYLFNRLVSLNEVGGDPSRFGSSDEEFHRFNRGQRRRWPDQLLASSTHDTKRSEDVRARISVLSEIPAEWRAAINRWTRLNRHVKTKIEGALAPARNDEYLIYQTLVGTWPLTPLDPAGRAAYVARIQEYIVKAVREGGQNSNWLNPNESYEEALRRFIAGLLTSRRSARFPDDCGAFVAAILTTGLTNALAQQVLKLTAPGVPDIYQGTELWDDSLVDPDNRRPVDYPCRRTSLARIEGGADAAALWDERVDGRIKLFVTQRLLAVRRADPALFAAGDYTARTVDGANARRVLAFSRRYEGRELLTVVPRLAHALARDHERGAVGAVWSGTTVQVPVGTFENVLTGERIEANADGAGLAVAELLSDVPVAVLRRDDEDGNV